MLTGKGLVLQVQTDRLVTWQLDVVCCCTSWVQEAALLYLQFAFMNSKVTSLSMSQHEAFI